MSDNAAKNKKDDGFRPLVAASLDHIETEDLRKKEKPEKEADSAFHIMYDDKEKERQKKKKPVKENFIPFYEGHGTQFETHEKTEEEIFAEIEARKEEGYREGKTKGEKDGYDEGYKKGVEFVESFGKILAELEGLWKRMVDDHQTQIMELVCKVAEKLVYGKVAIENEIVKKAILEAFELIPNPVNVTIYVNSEDYDYIESVKDSFFDEVKGLTHISVITDHNISRGGCKLETTSGEVDARIETRLEAIRKSVIEAGGKKLRDWD